MAEYLKFSNVKGYKIYEFKISLNSLKCGSPTHLSGMYLYNVKETELQCENALCTENKYCKCIETTYNKTVRINCTNAKLDYKPFIKQNFSHFEIYLGFNNLQTFSDNSAGISMQVTWFGLSNNFIVDIPKNIFSYYPKLQVLNFSRNRLVSIPSEEQWRMMYSLEVLQLEGNQFPCNCPGLELKETLTSLIVRDIIKNVNHIKCVVPLEMKDKVIYNLTDPEFGCPFINWVLILSLTLSFLLFILAIVFVANVF